MLPVNEDTAAAVAQAVKNGELPGEAKSLAEAMCRVMEKISYVRKDKKMQGGGSYNYVSVEAIIDALRPEMIRHRLVLLPVGVETMHQGDHGRQLHLRVKYTFEMIHAQSGQSKPVVVVGEGMDVGDKSSNKAMTAARKYALIMAFNIETGTDPDDTPSSQQERTPVQQQQAAPAKPVPSPQTGQQSPPANIKLRGEVMRALEAAKSADDFHRICANVEKDHNDKLLTPADLDAIRPVAVVAKKRLGIVSVPATAK